MTVATLGWPEHWLWTLILQSVFEGRAQEIHFSLMSEHSLAFEAFKTAFLRLYELVPEANLQKFRNLMKPDDQTNSEFVEFYSHLDICPPVTTGSDSSCKLNRYSPQIICHIPRTYLPCSSNKGHVFDSQ